MHRMKNYALISCLFVFLLIVLGNALHLSPGAAVLTAITGTPLVIVAFNRLARPGSTHANCRSEREEVAYVSDK